MLRLINAKIRKIFHTGNINIQETADSKAETTASPMTSARK